MAKPSSRREKEVIARVTIKTKGDRREYRYTKDDWIDAMGLEVTDSETLTQLGKVLSAYEEQKRYG